MTNLPVCAAIVPGAYRLVPGQRRRGALADFDVPSAVLATGGMLPLVSMPAPELTGQAPPTPAHTPQETQPL